MGRLQTGLCGIQLENPVIAASGTYGYGVEFDAVADLNAMGGLVVKGLSREPIAGKPIPTNLIDMVIVPGVGFSKNGYRIGRGMGFYDRFLAQPEFDGVSCGLAFAEQVIDDVPVLDHDMPLSMLTTDRGVARFAAQVIQSK